MRPYSMRNAITIDKVSLGVRSLREITIQAPAAAKVQPAGTYRLYDEPDTTDQSGVNVICSGTALMISEGSPTASARMIGVLLNDAKPGDKAVCAIEGLFLLPAASSLGAADTLNGKAAYYEPDDGLIYDATAAGRLLVGYFAGGIKELEPNNQPISGYNFVSVYLDPSVMQTNTAAALPADASLTNTTTPYVEAEISGFGGLEQNLTISATSPKPNYQSGDLTMTVTIEGTEVYSGPFTGTLHVTFTAGAGKTVALTVTDPDGVSGSGNYTVTTHATNAPSAWTRV